MTETERMNQSVRCDKNVLLSMYSETWDLYKKEKDLFHKNNSCFLLISLLFSLMITALIMNAAERLIEMHTSFMGDASSSYLIFSASLSIVLPLTSLIFLLSLLKKWENCNKSISDSIKDKSDRVVSLEKVLLQAGLIPMELCAAYNNKKSQTVIQAEDLDNSGDLKDDEKKRKDRKEKTSLAKKEYDEFEISRSLLGFFRRFVLFLFIVVIILGVFMGYSLVSTMLLWS